MLLNLSTTTADIPVIMLSYRDGEALVEEIQSGGTVSATMGAIPGGPFEFSSFIFSSNLNQIDPDPENNGHTTAIMTGTFSDSFETGDCSRWCGTEP